MLWLLLCFLHSVMCCWLLLQESEVLSMSEMEAFIEKQTKLLEMQPADAPEKEPERTPEGCVDGDVSDAAAPAQDFSNSDPGE